MSVPVIQTRNLSKIYVRDIIGSEHGRLKIHLFNRKVAALRDLTMEVKEGEIFGLLGPNGAGKTTTIKILMTIHGASSGQATIMGKPLGDKSVKAKIGFLPENPYFYDYLKGWEFLNYYGQLYGIPRRLRLKRAEELMHRVGIGHAANLPLRGYSKGMLQRIGIAQALLNDPKLVILDEPQSGLDPLGRKEVRDIILSLREEGKTVCFSSHILSDAELVCDRVAILHKGGLVSMGRMGELLSARVKEIEVVVTGLDESKVMHYRAHAKRHLSEAGQTMFIVENQSLADAIVADTLAAGGRVMGLTPRKETLEEHFIGKVAPGANV